VTTTTVISAPTAPAQPETIEVKTALPTTNSEGKNNIALDVIAVVFAVVLSLCTISIFFICLQK